MLKSKGHQKHPKLERVKLEKTTTIFSVWGLKCKDLKVRVEDIVSTCALNSTIYIDQKHVGEETAHGGLEVLELSAGLDNNETQTHSVIRPHSKVAFSRLLQTKRFAFFNGNHFQKERSILFYDSDRIDSILKRKEKLKSVELVLNCTEGAELDARIRVGLNDTVQVLGLENQEAIGNFFRNELSKSVPVLKALILAGGKSSRMGEDKSQIKVAGKSQEQRLIELCEHAGLETYLSKSTYAGPMTQPNLLVDRMLGMGPLGAIATAFMHDPNAAWLVLACDLLLFDREDLQYLIQNRDVSRIATTLKSTQKDFPEPLAAIWEPSAYPKLLDYVSQGYSCPRKVLINEDSFWLEATNEQAILNVNTPEDLESIKELIADIKDEH